MTELATSFHRTMSQFRANVADYETRAHELIAALAADPTPSQAEELQDQLGFVLACRGALKSSKHLHRTVAAFIREHMREFEPSARETVAQWARRHEGRALKLLQSPEGSDRRPHNAEIAASFGVELARIQSLLETVRGRRTLGWPVHIGNGEFAFERAMLDERRASFLASLPDVEPRDHHLEPLPEDYGP